MTALFCQMVVACYAWRTPSPKRITASFRREVGKIEARKNEILLV